MKKDEKKTEQPVCALDYAFKRIGGKHKARILWYIAKSDNVLRYGEIKKKIGSITPKMLTQTLRELEEDKLINRKVYTVVPPKVEYSLTDTGKELIPFLGHLAKWAVKELEKENHPLFKNYTAE